MEKYLYKYYAFDENNYSIDNLTIGKICFSCIDRFNDPFEAIGLYNFREKNEEQKFEIMGINIDEVFTKKFVQWDKEGINFNYRVCCFTEKYNNPLLWAHYANAHQGFCVAYLEGDVRRISSEFKKVKYSDTMPESIISGNIGGGKTKLNDLLYSKSKVWKYEDEWRAVYKLSKEDMLDSNIEEYLNRNEDSGHIFNCRKNLKGNEYIKSSSIILKDCKPQIIYIGLRVNSSNKKKIIEIAEQHKIKYKFMEMETEKYEFK